MNYMSPSERNQRAVAGLAEKYWRDGYDVVVEPGPEQRPAFLAAFEPDLIVRGKGEQIVVEATSGGPGERLRKLAEVVASEPGWKLDVLFVGRDPEDIETPRPLISESQAEERMERARALAGQGSPDAACLLLWSGIDAILRLMAERASIPLRNAPTGTLIRELYSAGELDFEVYTKGLELLKERNAVAHGFSAEGAEALFESLDLLSAQILDELHQPMV